MTTRPRVTYVLTKHVQPSQTFVTGEIAELQRQGVEVDVIAVERGDVLPAPGQWCLFICDLDVRRAAIVKQHLKAVVRRPLGYLRFLVLVVLLRREMGDRPELVPWWLLPGVAATVTGRGSTALHAHFAWSGAAAAQLLAPLTGLPWSVTLHAKDIFSKQRNLRHKLAGADRLVTVCDYNLRWMQEHLHLSRDVTLVICGVDVPAPGWPRVAEADVVSVGRLVEKKGFDTLIRAAAIARTSLPALKVDIIGGGAEHDRLESLIDELNLSGCVRLLGSRSHDESLARIAGAQVFCLPARIAPDGDRDSMPVVIKEAMARDVPVVASDQVAIPEMLDGGCGVMVPPDDPSALADALVRVLSDDGLRTDIAKAARERVEERFTMTGETTRLKELLLHGPVQRGLHARFPRWT